MKSLFLVRAATGCSINRPREKTKWLPELHYHFMDIWFTKICFPIKCCITQLDLTLNHNFGLGWTCVYEIYCWMTCILEIYVFIAAQCAAHTLFSLGKKLVPHGLWDLEGIQTNVWCKLIIEIILALFFCKITSIMIIRMEIQAKFKLLFF